MHILVTGGTGFIGSHTVVELINAGHQVTIIDNLINSKRSVIDQIALILDCATPEFHQVDVCDEGRLEKVVAGAGFEAVIHFAGLKAVGESVQRPLDYWQANVGGSTTLFQVLARHDVKTIVYSSSATVYGEPDRVPIREDMPVKQASNPYGATKQVVEQILMDLHTAHQGLNIAVLRYFNPVGAHESGLIGEDPSGVPNNLMPIIAQAAIGKLPEVNVLGSDYPTPDGTGVRDYIHVVDLALGHVAALDRLTSAPGKHVWNLGTGKGTSVLEMIAAFAKVADVHVPYRVTQRREGDVAALWADPSKAEKDLGWKAERSLEQMCADTWRWQQTAMSLTS